jgi:hypothetical protein
MMANRFGHQQHEQAAAGAGAVFDSTRTSSADWPYDVASPKV